MTVAHNGWKGLVLAGLIAGGCIGPLLAQETALADREPLLEALKEQALQVDLSARQVDAEQKVLWSRDASWVTVPGRSVSLRLEGTTTLIVVQLTPYRRSEAIQLLVQTQVWVRDSIKNSFRNYTHINNLSVVSGEKILYYPLGKRREGSVDGAPEIEMTIRVAPYSGPAPAENQEAKP